MDEKDTPKTYVDSYNGILLSDNKAWNADTFSM